MNPARNHPSKSGPRLPPAPLASGLALLLLTACTSPPPRQTIDTGVHPPSNWTAPGAQPQPVSTNWWTSFNDPRIDRLVEEAWKRNPTLQIAVARLDAAEAEARIAGAGTYPTLGLSAAASRRKQNFIGFPIPGSEDSVLSSHTSTYGVSLNTLWEIDVWGRVRAGHKAGLAQLQASQEELRGAYLSLAAQAIKSWTATVEARRQIELAQRTVASYRVTSERVRARYERGLRSSLDLRLALNSLANAEALLHQRQQQHDSSLRQLEILAGRYPGASLETATELPAMPAEVPAGLPSDLLQRRPDLVAAERRLAAAQSLVDQSKASLYPRISLTASGGTSTEELSDLVSSDFSVWNWAINLAQPILEGGRLRASVRAARARSRQVLADYSQTLLRAFAEVESTLAAEHWLALQENRTAEAVRQAQAAEELARDRYDSGLADIITVLEAQRRALTSESQWITLQRLRLDARVDLHLALGGGFSPDRPPQPETGTPPDQEKL